MAKRDKTSYPADHCIMTPAPPGYKNVSDFLLLENIVKNSAECGGDSLVWNILFFSSSSKLFSNLKTSIKVQHKMYVYTHIYIPEIIKRGNFSLLHLLCK